MDGLVSQQYVNQCNNVGQLLIARAALKTLDDIDTVKPKCLPLPHVLHSDTHTPAFICITASLRPFARPVSNSPYLEYNLSLYDSLMGSRQQFDRRKLEWLRYNMVKVA